MPSVAKRAKLFLNGRSQAVRLPAEFRFEGDEIFIRRDADTGDVILSMRPDHDWRSFMRIRDQLGPLGSDERLERPSTSSPQRDPFADWIE